MKAGAGNELNFERTYRFWWNTVDVSTQASRQARVSSDVNLSYIGVLSGKVRLARREVYSAP